MINRLIIIATVIAMTSCTKVETTNQGVVIRNKSSKDIVYYAQFEQNTYYDTILSLKTGGYSFPLFEGHIEPEVIFPLHQLKIYSLENQDTVRSRLAPMPLDSIPTGYYDWNIMSYTYIYEITDSIL